VAVPDQTQVAGTAPLLLLGLGNPLLGDDGVGLRLLEALRSDVSAWGGRVEAVDGGTQGMALLGYLERRRAVVLLDAVALGAPPGTVHVLEGDTLLAACTPGGQSAHEMGAGELLRAAAMIGSLPERIALVGVEPANVATGVGLSATVEAALAEARRQAVAVIDRGLAAVS
jgi:hydrogenase maturation protease